MRPDPAPLTLCMELAGEEQTRRWLWQLRGAAEGVPVERSRWDPSSGHCATARWLLASQRGEKSIWRMILLISLGRCLASPGRKAPINPPADLQLGFPRDLSCSKTGCLQYQMHQMGQQEGGDCSHLPTSQRQPTLMAPPFSQQPWGPRTLPRAKAGAAHLSMLDLVSAILLRLEILNPKALPLWPLFM